MFISTVIAVYNEEDNVKELTERIFQSFKKLKIPFELIYVIDGTDKTNNILMDLKKDKSNLILDYSPKMRGFRNAFIRGFSLISKKSTHVLTMDGDLNHQPEEIGKFISEMEENGSSIVIGSRYTKMGKIEKLAIWKRAVSLFANIIIKLLWGIRIKDKTSGYRLYKREVIDDIVPKCKSSNFEFLFEILIRARKKRYKMSEVGIVFKARERGVSKFQFWKVVKGYMRLMLSR